VGHPEAADGDGRVVVSKIWRGTAKVVNALPTADNVEPAHTRRKAEERRSGPRSVSRRMQQILGGR
jgi:hypothetical protein